MVRRSIKVKLNDNNERDKKINEYLDHQESITDTVKLLLFMALKSTGNKDLRNAIISKALSEHVNLLGTTEKREKKQTNANETHTSENKEKKEEENFNFFDNDDVNL